ncbi:MAG: GNAT family N-acetyltransferase [Anaerolineales bacterium]|nr:GNAT family N-acetyltransferase [Chloroflexota bacterium]MBL7161860.1 GNAT family N-acetyltransferase [Anaerolineales bacterium]
MELELKSVLEYGVTETTQVLNQGFSDYVVPIHIGLEQLFSMLRFDSIDVSSSRVVIRDGDAVGAALIARRGWSSRLAGMAILPGARGLGVGRWLMKQLVDEARERGDRRMELEVIEQNGPAVSLYQQAGFVILRRLVSYILEEPAGEAHPIDEIDLRVMGRLVNAYGLSDLPWQISGETVTQFGPPYQAYCHEDSYVAISSPESPQVTLRSMLLMPEAQKKNQGGKLLQGLFARFPNKTWRVPAIFPEEFGGLFERVGFEKEELSQVQMVIGLK